MSQEPKNKEEGFMYKFASFIVDKRNLIFLIVAIGLVFSVFSRSWVQVENQLSAYLPKESETDGGRVHHLRHGQAHAGERLV